MSLGYVETICEAQVDGPTLTAAAAATCLPAAVKGPSTLKPGYFDKVGKKLRIEAWGKITSLITTPGTARFDVRFQSTVIFDGLAVLLDTVAAHTNVGWHLLIDLTCRAIGTTGNFSGHGIWVCEDILGVPATAPKGVLTAILPWNSTPAVGANVDLTIQNTVDLFFTQTVATGSMTLQQFAMYSPN